MQPLANERNSLDIFDETSPKVLISALVTTIRKFAHKSWKYMDVYDKELEGKTAEWAVSKYKSHCRIPENIKKLME
ncbi:hypothetical protein BCR41DRAFT_395274 [Rhizophagus clarus]|uniref:Uncharacterized protein n=1 Tax=Rhizophagus clarus TaxID=94130 RepID=A0A8H3QUR1_9GLOM|nr:hypothetical protein BCR41DRAFT_395274 [Rhizophagus clarus]